MKRQYWITMQDPGNKDKRAVWTGTTPRNQNRAKGVKSGDLIAVYVGAEENSPGGIKYVGEIDCRVDEPDGPEWTRIARLKRELLVDDDHLCSLPKLAPILEPGRSFNSRNRILAVKRRCGRTVGPLSEEDFRAIWPAFSELTSRHADAAERAAAESAVTDNEPSVPGMAPVEVKKAVEKYAVKRARTYFRNRGYKVGKYQKRSPYDLECQRGSTTCYVEVKGTQNRINDAVVFITPREVKHARGHPRQSLLFVLHSIEFTRKGQKLRPTRGRQCIAKWTDVDGRLQVSLYGLKTSCIV